MIKNREKERSENIEQLILDVAEDIFLERGYSLTSTSEIARRVGCNQALIHYYFRTKENLFIKLFEKKFITFVSAVSVSKERCTSFQELIRCMISKHLEIISENPRLPYLIINEMTVNPERFKSITEKIKVTVEGLTNVLEPELKREIDAGRIRDITVIDLLVTILSLNLFPFIAQPLISQVLSLSWEEFNKFTKEREEEIFKIVWQGIQANK